MPLCIKLLPVLLFYFIQRAQHSTNTKNVFFILIVQDSCFQFNIIIQIWIIALNMKQLSRTIKKSLIITGY